MDNESNYGQREVCSIVARGWWKIYHPLSNVNENCLKIDGQNGHFRTLAELGAYSKKLIVVEIAKKSKFSRKKL